MIDAVAREGHFADHLRPVWEALPAELRGTFWGVEEPEVRELPDARNLCMVASYRDLKLARRHGRFVAYFEHGAGQSYLGTHSNGSYAGGYDRAGVVAALTPGPHAASAHRGSHPAIPSIEVGIPKLDGRHREGWDDVLLTSALPDRAADPVLAVAFHWDCRVVPETRSAVPHYKRQFEALRERFPRMIGHGHPRDWERLAKWYERAGIEPVADFEEVMDRADIYAADNSSTIFEFASLDRPVVVLNCPHYRPFVEHGLRFWECADVGVQVDSGTDLIAAVELAAADPPDIAAQRREVIGRVYCHPLGRATERAVEAVVALDHQYADRTGEPLRW